MIKIYRKTATIKAEQFDPENGVIPDGVFDKEFEHTTSGMISAMVNELQTGNPAHNWHIKTLEGDLKVNTGDWIATGIKGEHWPIADNVFKKTYVELPVIPEEVSLSIEDWKKHRLGLDQIFGMVYQYEITRTQGSTAINWIMCGNQDMFARAWLDGYVVEEEK